MMTNGNFTLDVRNILFILTTVYIFKLLLLFKFSGGDFSLLQCYVHLTKISKLLASMQQSQTENGLLGMCHSGSPLQASDYIWLQAVWPWTAG